MENIKWNKRRLLVFLAFKASMQSLVQQHVPTVQKDGHSIVQKDINVMPAWKEPLQPQMGRLYVLLVLRVRLPATKKHLSVRPVQKVGDNQLVSDQNVIFVLKESLR